MFEERVARSTLRRVVVRVRAAGGRPKPKASTECLCVCGDGRTTTNQRAPGIYLTSEDFSAFQVGFTDTYPCPRSASAPCELDGADIVAARTTHMAQDVWT